MKYQQAESSATTDYLTGLPNARSLFLHLDRELARCKRSHTPLAVMVCDLDGFKQINDRFGHLEGNKVLRSFADFMKAVCREYDYVARMGGDEFVIVAPGMTPQAAEEKGAHLLSLAREAGRQVCGHDFLSVSSAARSIPRPAPTPSSCSPKPTAGCTSSSRLNTNAPSACRAPRPPPQR